MSPRAIRRELMTCQISGLAPIFRIVQKCIRTRSELRAHQIVRRLRCAGFTPHKIQAELSSNGSQVELRTAGLTPHFHVGPSRHGDHSPKSNDSQLSSPQGWRFSFTLSRSSLESLFHGLLSAVYFGFVVIGRYVVPMCVATVVCSIDVTTASNSTFKQLSTLSSGR